MEIHEENIYKFKIPVITSPSPDMPEGYGFVHKVGKDRILSSFPQKDFYLPVFITRTANLLEYVDISYDDTIFTMQRQEVNPWFIEFSFFDTIKRNKVNKGSDLTLTMINYIKTVVFPNRPEVATLSDADLKIWFDNSGRYELPWNKGLPNETDLDTLDRLKFLNSNIISKAFTVGIDINK